MRVLLDTNFLISYLLSPDNNGTIQYIVEAAFENKYTLLVPPELIDEHREKVRGKKYLLTHIPQKAVLMFINAIMSVGEIIPKITEVIPAVGRDIKDDYILAYALVGEADYLVSGDEDLQVIKQIEKVSILSPIKFYNIIHR